MGKTKTLAKEKQQIIKEEAYAWFKKIEPFYYSPFSAFSVELTNLKAFFGYASITPSLNEPSTWRYVNTNKFLQQESELVLNKVISAYYYLAQGENLFSGEAALSLQRSFPYFEWPSPTKIASLTEGLGQWQIILLKRKEQKNTIETIKAFFTAHQINFIGRLLVINDRDETIEEARFQNTLLQNKTHALTDKALEGKGPDVISIKQRYLPSYDIEEESFIEARSLTALFKGEPHALFINPHGLYEARATKTEITKYLQELFLPQEHPAE